MGGIAADLFLPGQAEGRVDPPEVGRLYDYVCLDPPALRLTYRTEGVVGTAVILARAGRAVFYVDRRQLYAGGVADDQRTVAAFVPALAAAFP